VRYPESPAALRDEDRPVLRTCCFRCGLTVCKHCSDVRLTWYPRDRKVRICLNCMEQESCLAVHAPTGKHCAVRDLEREHSSGLHRTHDGIGWPVSSRERRRWADHQHWAEHRGDSAPAGT
jgi:hypothetical protein